MVVQLILASRMGTRELESDEEDENAFEVPREQLSKFTGKAPPTKLQLQEAIEKAAIEADKKQNNNSSNDSKDEQKNDSDATPVDEKKLDSNMKPETDQVETKKTETEVEAKPETTEKMDADKENSSNEEEKTTNSETKEKNDSEKPEKTEVNDEKPTEKTTTENEVSEKPAVKKPLNKTARMIEVEEYLVKFKNFSYLHCQWLTEEELHRGDKRISQKIKRFKQKREKSVNLMDLIEDEHFNPDYIEVDRVLDSSTHTDEQTNVMTKHYLVKWRSLPYEDCTWELESDVDPNKIKEYIKWKDPPPEEKIYKRR